MIKSAPLSFISAVASLVAIITCLLSLGFWAYYQERIATLELRPLSCDTTKVPDRHLSETEKDKLSAIFSEKAKAVPHITIVAVDDPEARQYTKEFIKIMRDAGLKVNSDGDYLAPNGISADEHPYAGLYVSIPDKEHPTKEGKELMVDLESVGFHPKYDSITGWSNPDKYVIIIGYKE